MNTVDRAVLAFGEKPRTADQLARELDIPLKVARSKIANLINVIDLKPMYGTQPKSYMLTFNGRERYRRLKTLAELDELKETA